MSSSPSEAVYIDPLFSFMANGTVVLEGPLLGIKLISSKSLKDAYHPFGHPCTCVCFYYSAA